MTFNAPISSPVTVSSVLLALLILLLCRTVRSSDNASTVPKPPFADWLPGHSQTEGGLLLLDRRSLAEGEVLLFRTKKSRHRAIAVMTAHHQQKLHGQTSSRFADALTFKEWLRRDEKWRSRIRRFAPGPGLSGQKQLYGLEPSRLFSSSSPILSTSMLSPSGVAFLGWPNSLLLSSRPTEALPSRQTVTGRVMFIPKRQSREVIPQRRSGMVVYLFHTDPDLLFAPRVPHSVQAFIGFDGRILLENNAPPTKGLESDAFAKSSSAQLPRWPCYAFSLLDKGWRVELEVWTERCSPPTTDDEAMEQHTERPEDDGWVSQRTFLQMDTPVARNRLSRHVAVGKSGDGAIDFLGF
uniref:Signal peptide protein n=1 Tax=Globodera pallida TaxID=36090 RepID=A0A183BIJ0_GLOPA